MTFCLILQPFSLIVPSRAASSAFSLSCSSNAKASEKSTSSGLTSFVLYQSYLSSALTHVDPANWTTYLVSDKIKHEQRGSQIVRKERLGRSRPTERKYAEVEFAAKDEEDDCDTQVLHIRCSWGFEWKCAIVDVLRLERSPEEQMGYEKSLGDNRLAWSNACSLRNTHTPLNEGGYCD